MDFQTFTVSATTCRQISCFFDTQKLWQLSWKTMKCRPILYPCAGLAFRCLLMGHDTFFKKIFVLETLGALRDTSSNLTVFNTTFHKWSRCKFTKHKLEKVSCPISSPRQKLSITKDSRKKYPMVKEESCHNFLSTRSCFCSSVSDGSYLMVWMTLRLLCMPAQIIQMMAFAQIMDIWRPGRSMEDHLKHMANHK